MRISKESRIFFHTYKTLFGIAYQHFQDAENYSRGMPIPRTIWKENHRTQKRLLTENASIVAVVFSAFTLESLINAYAVEHLSEDSFTKLEQKTPSDKWKTIPGIITRKAISTDGKAYRDLLWLFKKRNGFAHSKTRTITLGKLFDEDFQDEGLITVQDARRAINTVKELVSELKQLDPRIDADWLTDVQEVARWG